MLLLLEAHDAGRTLNVTSARIRQLVQEGVLAAAAGPRAGRTCFAPKWSRRCACCARRGDERRAAWAARRDRRDPDPHQTEDPSHGSPCGHRDGDASDGPHRAGAAGEGGPRRGTRKKPSLYKIFTGSFPLAADRDRRVGWRGPGIPEGYTEGKQDAVTESYTRKQDAKTMAPSPVLEEAGPPVQAEARLPSEQKQEGRPSFAAQRAKPAARGEEVTPAAHASAIAPVHDEDCDCRVCLAERQARVRRRLELLRASSGVNHRDRLRPRAGGPRVE